MDMHGLKRVAMAAGFPQDDSQDDGNGGGGDDYGAPGFEPVAFEPQGIDVAADGPVTMKGLIAMLNEFQQNSIKNMEMMMGHMFRNYSRSMSQQSPTTLQEVSPDDNHNLHTYANRLREVSVCSQRFRVSSNNSGSSRKRPRFFGTKTSCWNFPY